MQLSTTCHPSGAIEIKAELFKLDAGKKNVCISNDVTLSGGAVCLSLLVMYVGRPGQNIIKLQ